MSKFYRRTKVKMNYDYTTDNYNIHSYIKFDSNIESDDEYYYKFNNDLILDKYHTYNNNNFIQDINTYLKKYDTFLLRMNDIISITLTKNLDVNVDAKGIRALDWKLHFWKSYTISDNDTLTFHDFIIACYKIKSHKFENKYELFSGIENLNDIVVVDKYKWQLHHIFIDVKFDHTS